jgi:hypothetical protein
VRAWLWYAAVSAAFLVPLATGVAVLLPGNHAGAVWAAAGIAFAVQLVAFAVLVAGRRRVGFVAGWGLGMLLRFAALAALAVWVTVTGAPHAATALLSLVGFVMVLVLIEPLLLKLTD